MTISYTPPGASHLTISNTDHLHAVLKAGADRYGAYPFSNRVLAEDTGLSVNTVTFTLAYLKRMGRWSSVRGPVQLKADPRLAGRELRRLGVLVPVVS